MNFFKRSLKYIKAKKLKTILLGIIFLLVGNLVIIGFGVSQASENAKTLTRKKMSPVVKYTSKDDFIYSEDEGILYVDLKLIDEMAKDKRVDAVSSYFSIEAYAKDFDPVVPKKDNDYFDEIEDITSEDDEFSYEETNITLKGNRFSDMIEFKTGTYEIVEGRFYNDEEIKNQSKVAVIEQDLAKQNNLKVGDIIDIKMIDSETANNLGYTDDDIYHSLKIIGIYKSTLEDENNYWTAGYKANIILIPANSMKDIYLEYIEREINYYKDLYDEDIFGIEFKEELIYSYGASYLLKDPKDVDDFVNDYNGKLNKGYKLDKNDETFKKFAKPLDTISLFSNIIVIALLINSIVIISLVTALTLKSREYEIGVLVSLGVQKWKVIMQLFLELLIIAMASFVLATITGSLIASKVGDKVLDIQSSMSNSDDNDFDYGYGYYYNEDDYFTNISQEDFLDEYKVTIDALLIVKIFVVGILVVFVSILAPALMILRYNPKQILMTTN